MLVSLENLDQVLMVAIMGGGSWAELTFPNNDAYSQACMLFPGMRDASICPQIDVGEEGVNQSFDCTRIDAI